MSTLFVVLAVGYILLALISFRPCAQLMRAVLSPHQHNAKKLAVASCFAAIPLMAVWPLSIVSWHVAVHYIRK